MSTHLPESETPFLQLAASLSHDDPRVTRSTMMGLPCLRVDGKFFACVERASGDLVIKLSAERVNDLVRTGNGRPFAPNGRVFKEWVACPGSAHESWLELLHEAKVNADAAATRDGAS